MALLGNYSVLTKSAGRSFGGSTVSECRSQWGQSGALRGRYVQTGGFSSKASVPNGYRPPYCWQLAIKSGGLSSTNLILGSGALSAPIAGGRNGVATIPGTGALSATGQLVVSAVATILGSGTISAANLLAILNGTATITGTGSVSAAELFGKGNVVATAAGTGSLTLTSYATGTLGAEILPFTDLSPEALSAAVWSASEGAFLYAVAHNRVVTDPVAGTITVYDTDDTTVLYSASLWADADGTTPYAGSGAERRDRLA